MYCILHWDQWIYSNAQVLCTHLCQLLPQQQQYYVMFTYILPHIMYIIISHYKLIDTVNCQSHLSLSSFWAPEFQKRSKVNMPGIAPHYRLLPSLHLRHINWLHAPVVVSSPTLIQLNLCKYSNASPFVLHTPFIIYRIRKLICNTTFSHLLQRRRINICYYRTR